MAETPFILKNIPLKPSEIPSETAIIDAGKAILDSSPSWKPGKTYHRIVKSLYSPKRTEDGAPWHCRVSEHTTHEATFDQLWDKLAIDKATNEKEFVTEIKKVTKVKELSPTAQIWAIYYTFAPPISPRTFTVLQVTHLETTSPRTGYIVSLPIDLSSPEDAELAKLEEPAVRGRYASVERVRELDDGITEWRMATSSTPGGSIPTFVVESSMPGKIAQDVPHFLKWLHSLPKQSEVRN